MIRKVKSLKKLGLVEDFQTALEELEGAMGHMQVSEKGKIV